VTYNIQDQLGCLGSCFLFWAGCGLCLLCQEVAQLKGMGYYGGGQAGMGSQSTTIVSNPSQQLMYSAPIAVPTAVPLQPGGGYNTY